MIRIYCDSNVFRLLKERHPSFSVELKETFESLKDKLLFIYSEAHLDDLKDSTNQHYLDEDLDVIETYTKDNYFAYDHIKEKRFQCYLAGAKEAFYSHDYEAARKSMDHPFDFEKLFDDLDPSPELSALKGIMKAYMDMPISSLGATFDMSQMDEHNQQFFDKMMPGYHPNMSIKDFIQSIQPYTKYLLTDNKELTELRKHASQYFQTESYSYEKWGMEFDQKLKESAFGKSFLEIVDASLTDKQKNDDLHRFCYAYSLLETYGITQERDNKNKLKKFTYDSLHRDAAHAYYASYCDYLVTDDKGLQVKAQIMYSLFGLSTKILSSQDFINSKSLLLANEESLDSFKNSFIYDTKHGFQIFDKTNIASNINIKEFKTSHPYFNYFNRLQLINDDGVATHALFCRRDSHADFIMYRELEAIVNKLIAIFGVDSNGRGSYSFTENGQYEDNEVVRKWQFNNLVFELIQSHKSWGRFIVLTMNIS